jgi:hypothetical protein
MMALGLLLAPSVAFNQSLAVNPAFKAGSYTPLTGAQRWQRWWKEDGGSPSIHVESFATAAWLQAWPAPKAWGQDTGGFFERLGSSYGGNLIENTMHEGLAATYGTDPRYFACSCKGFFHRSGHALKMTFLTYNHDGQLALDIPQLAGAYGGSMIESTWWPNHYSALVQGVQDGHIEMGFIGAVHLAQEFSPELKRMFHRRRGQTDGAHTAQPPRYNTSIQ